MFVLVFACLMETISTTEFFALWLGGAKKCSNQKQDRKRTEYCRSPLFGVGRRGSPRFVPICSDFPVFFRFVPICAPCFRECPDLFRFVPICSVFFRFVPICFQNKSEQIRETPFCRPLLQIPDTVSRVLFRRRELTGPH